jgi:putative ABC transport system permease protein
MKLLDLIATANHNLWRSKLRTFLTVLAIFVGSFTIILTTAINAGVGSFIDAQVDSAGGEGYLEIMPASFEEQLTTMMSGSPTEYNPEKNSSDLAYISTDTLERVKQLDHINPESVKPFYSVSVEYITSAQTDKKYKLNVSELPSDTVNVDMVTGRNIATDATDYEIALAPGYADVLGYTDASIIGQTVTLAVKATATGATTDVTATVTGVQAPGVVISGDRSWINTALNDQIHTAMSTGLPEAYASRFVFATAEFDPTISDEQLTTLKDQLKDLGLSAMTVEDQIGMVKTFFDVILIVFTAFGGIALLAASIGIINTLFMSVQERTREIGLMKAVGMGSGKVFLAFSIEAILLGFWGSVLGIGLSFIVGNIGQAIATQTFLADFPTFQLVKFTWQNLLIITLIIMAIAFLAGTLPARRAAKKNPIDALRYE